MFALAKWGAGAKPQQKRRCHPEVRPQAAWRRRISCRAHLQARRGTGTMEFDVNNRNGLVKRICLLYQKTKIKHSIFCRYSY